MLINSKLIQKTHASISILDRGFRFGEGLFETLRVYNSKIYQWELHISRLKEGLTYLDIKINLEQLLNNALLLIQQNSIQEGLLKIIITSGEKSIGYLRCKDSSPNIILETISQKIPSHNSITACLSKYRKASPNIIPTHFKILHNINSVLAKNEAISKNYQEALQTTEQNIISEFSSGNIFWTHKKIIYTPSLKNSIVNGTIRKIILNSSPYRVQEGSFYIEDLIKSDEIFLTNINYLVLSIKKLDSIWCGNNFAIAKKIYDLISADIKKI